MLLALALALVAPAEPTRVAGWGIVPYGDRCTMGSTFMTKSGVKSLFLVNYNSKLNLSTVTFSDPSIKSRKKGDIRKLHIFFTAPPLPIDDSWGERDFTVGFDEDGVTTLSTELNGEFIKDIRRNKTVAFTTDTVVLQSYQLEGSVLAVPALIQCAKNQQISNPSDPFAE